MITSNPLWKLMKPTIDTISTENLSKSQVCIGKGKLVTLESMSDGYIDDMEVAGLTLFSEKPEGGARAAEDITIGGTKRYIPKTFAKYVQITEEALEDNKYKEALQLVKRLTASAWKTQDIDVANAMLASTTVVGGYDNVALASTSHVLPTGATQSNYMNASGVTYTPSYQAVVQARTWATQILGPNGLPDPVELKAVVCPEAQRDLWQTILGTPQMPGTMLNDINTVKSYGLELIPIRWFDSISTTFWGCLTDVENGLRALQRRKLRSDSWVADNEMVMNYGMSYRMALGWSNWRFWLQGNT